MKYCNHCGKELIDNAEWCPGCGCRVVGVDTQKPAKKEDKPLKGKGLGFVLSFFLGLIGFLLAVFLGDDECKAMAQKTFITCIIIGVVIGVIYGIVVGVALGGYY